MGSAWSLVLSMNVSGSLVLSANVGWPLVLSANAGWPFRLRTSFVATATAVACEEVNC
jgi:hypothetical protein